MALPLTTLAEQSSRAGSITPQIVLDIEGVDTLYGVVPIKKIVKIGDFNIGDPGIFIGGQIAIVDQESIISFSSGTSSEIAQTLNQDKGTNESISTMRVALVDVAGKITDLITPGNVVDDILGRKCKVWLGFPDTSWKDDYLVIHRGIIDTVESKSGVILFNISAPDKKKKTAIFPKGTTELTSAMDNSQVTCDVVSTADFFEPYIGPNGLVDESLKLYLRIDDEIMRYESKTGTQFGTITRGQLGTFAASHDDEATVESFYVLEGNAIDLALKLLLSGKNGPYQEDVAVTNFVRISPSETVANSIFFESINLPLEYNPVVGDYITTSGASNGANNVTNKQITAVTQTDTGWYIVIDGVSFVEENATSALISFRSQFDTLGPNAGVAFGNDEVDVTEHLDIKTKYLSSAEYRFYIKDIIENGQEFLSEQVYNPVAAYALPRKAQASVGIHTGPIPGSDIKTLNNKNVINPSKISINRSTNKNFYNTIVYKHDESAIEDRFTSGLITIDGTSVTQIPVGNVPLVLEARGLRDDLSAQNLAQQSANRRLRKYKFGAEYIQGIETDFKTGFEIEIGDKVICDLGSLKVSDINTGKRTGDPRLFEVVNKRLNIGKGQISFDLVDTNYGLDSRYALIGPASYIKTGVSQTEIVIKPSFNTTRYGTNEYKKWEEFIGAYVLVRSGDHSIIGYSYLADISGNTLLLSTALGFVPLEDYVIEFADYDNQIEGVKVIYGFMSDGANNFGDGKIPYQMS